MKVCLTVHGIFNRYDGLYTDNQVFQKIYFTIEGTEKEIRDFCEREKIDFSKLVREA